MSSFFMVICLSFMDRALKILDVYVMCMNFFMSNKKKPTKKEHLHIYHITLDLTGKFFKNTNAWSLLESKLQ